MLTSARSFRRVLRVLARITSGLGLSLASRNSTHSAGENICRAAKTTERKKNPGTNLLLILACVESISAGRSEVFTQRGTERWENTSANECLSFRRSMWHCGTEQVRYRLVRAAIYTFIKIERAARRDEVRVRTASVKTRRLRGAGKRRKGNR